MREKITYIKMTKKNAENDLQTCMFFIGKYRYSFFPKTISDWNKLLQDVRSKPSIVAFRSAVLKISEPVENNNSEPWHSGSNRRMSIAGYLPKNGSLPRKIQRKCAGN